MYFIAFFYLFCSFLGYFTVRFSWWWFERESLHCEFSVLFRHVDVVLRLFLSFNTSLNSLVSLFRITFEVCGVVRYSSCWI
ncbi:hypothetical protein BJ742DRAFT_175414 [Cladochytrium replicatum]|nr:hypothetical protein BJ742DRAFT_175414 [Cladochytrium replicatum]